jgi:regulator of cell morphogenesis and NO signaling
MVSAERTVGAIVAEDYRSAAAFERHGIDFCCGGRATLGEACRAKGLEPEALLAEIAQAREAGPVDRGRNFSAWELGFLADYIVNTHHAWLRENDPSIAAYAAKIAEVHGANHPELVEISALFSKIAADMVEHLREEEELFFPTLKRLEAAGKSGRSAAADDLGLARDSLAGLGRDHEAIGEATHRIRALASGYLLPPDACATYALAYRKLAEFEEELHEHVHLENNVLFPRVSGSFLAVDEG